MSIRIRIDGMQMPDSGTCHPVTINHNGHVCMGAKIVGEAVYIPSKGDKLRAMKDEELAGWIEAITNCVLCPLSGNCEGDSKVSRATCKQHWFDWLREDAEV